MNDAKVYNAEDIKRVLAEKHGVEVKNVIRSQYSYVVMLGETEEEPETELR